MEQIIRNLKICLANELVFSTQAQSFHWNVTGMLFKPLHELFGEIYEGSYSSIDKLAEYIRIEGAMAPCCLADMYKNKTVNEVLYVPGTAKEMLLALMNMNKDVLFELENLAIAAENLKKFALVDYVSGLIDQHKKWNWILDSHLKD